MTKDRKYHIGIVGTGFIAKGLILALKHHPQIHICGVVTRRPLNSFTDFPVPTRLITHEINQLIRTADLVIECSGDAIHGTDMVEAVLKAGIPVVTMNPELHITSGTQLIKLGTLIEAEGDQPGSLAALDIEVKNMGFKPVVYGNIKGFLNLNPTQEDMHYWSNRQGISLPQVTAFTDGSKVQIEQALVANGLGATITQQGLSGLKSKSYEDGAHRLGKIADQLGQPISDYVLCAGAPAGVFVVTKHDPEQASYLKYLKLGDGPNYALIKPYHLCHLEIAKTVINVLLGRTDYNFNNGPHPTIQVVAIAKKDIPVGELVNRGLGSFVLRGEAVKIVDQPNAVPLTLVHQAEFVRPVPAGQIVTFADIKLPKTRALELWQQTVKEVVGDPIKTLNGEVKSASASSKKPLLSISLPQFNFANILKRN